MRKLGRIPILAAAVLALLGGIWAGLARLGWSFPMPRASLPLAHGPLMVSGFLGTLIGLERAVALGRRWSYAAPAATALGGIALLLGITGPYAPLLIVAGSLLLCAASVAVIRIQPLLFTTTMGLGAAAWLGGNVLWAAGRPLPEIVLWWIGFPVLTVAGERLQLSRLLDEGARRRVGFLLCVVALLAGAALSVAGGRGSVTTLGWRLAGVGLLGFAVWLLLYDIARRNLREPGLRRFIGACLLSGYVWLGLAGALAVTGAPLTPGSSYDAFLHAVFLGFVFSLIFGHAPIVLPAIAGRSVPFQRSFYLHLLLLHASLILRLAGELAAWPAARSWGGLLNAVALLLFPIVTARAVRSGRGAGQLGDAAGTARGDAAGTVPGSDAGAARFP